jgi:uncharacterized protein YehS (DUF1456 family)
MNNNDLFRRLRYAFNFSDDEVMECFKLAGYEATRAEISDWLKKEEDPAFQDLRDKQFAKFLNGMIVKNRGPREDKPIVNESSLSNNNVLRKLMVALNLRDVDVLEILALEEMEISKHELSAFFRNPSQAQYRPCKDQVLRNFVYGLQKRYRS